MAGKRTFPNQDAVVAATGRNGQRKKKTSAEKKAEIARANAGFETLARGEALPDTDQRDAVHFQKFGALIRAAKDSEKEQLQITESVAVDEAPTPVKSSSKRKRASNAQQGDFVTADNGRKRTKKKATKKQSKPKRVAIDEADADLIAAIEEALASFEVEPSDESSDDPLHMRTSPTDDRFGVFDIPLFSDDEKSRRKSAFGERILMIVTNLKEIAKQFFEDLSNHLDPKLTMVMGFMRLIMNADIRYLYDSLMSGIPETTRIILGADRITNEDILMLPRWTDEELMEHGVYADACQTREKLSGLASLEPLVFMIYVGSGTRQAGGVLRRWRDYWHPILKTIETHRHGRALSEPSTKLNLRGLARYGRNPMPWLPVFSETVFMVYLNAVKDTGIRSRYCFPELYSAIDRAREGVPANDLGPGLNSTWPLMQGLRGLVPRDQLHCCHCKRPVVKRSDPRYKKDAWRNKDPTRPGLALICRNCQQYEYRHKRPRPLHLESRLDFKESTPCTGCSWEGCTKICLERKPRDEWHCIPDTETGGWMWVCDSHRHAYMHRTAQLRKQQRHDGDEVGDVEEFGDVGVGLLDDADMEDDVDNDDDVDYVDDVDDFDDVGSVGEVGNAVKPSTELNSSFPPSPLSSPQVSLPEAVGLRVLDGPLVRSGLNSPSAWPWIPTIAEPSRQAWRSSGARKPHWGGLVMAGVKPSPPILRSGLNSPDAWPWLR